MNSRQLIGTVALLISFAGFTHTVEADTVGKVVREPVKPGTEPSQGTTQKSNPYSALSKKLQTNGASQANTMAIKRPWTLPAEDVSQDNKLPRTSTATNPYYELLKKRGVRGGRGLQIKPAVLPNEGRADYLRGMHGIEVGQYKDAAAAFEKAIRANDESGMYHLGKGVALMLADDASGKVHIERANRLEARDPLVKVWSYAWAKRFWTPGSAYVGNPPYEQPVSYVRALISACMNFHTNGMRDQAIAKYRELASVFARSEMARPEMIPFQYAMLEPVYRAGKYAEALELIEKLRPGNPNDLKLLMYSANCKLALRRYREADEEYTRVLLQRPEIASLFLGRARAQAEMSNWNAATEDLAVAKSLDAKMTATFLERDRRLFDAAKARIPSTSPAQLLAQLKQQASSQNTAESLYGAAEELMRADASRRFDRDASFTRGVALRKQAADIDPNNVDKLVALARFCMYPRQERPARLDPTGSAKTNIPLGRTDIHRADAALARAIKLDGNHVGALTAMALLFEFKDDPNNWIKYVEHAFKQGGLNFDLARLYMDFHTMIAGQLQADAAVLRSPRIHYEWQGNIQYRITTYPSAADLALAAKKEAQAKEHLRLAPKPLNQWRDKNVGNMQGLFADAVYYKWNKDFNKAVASADAMLNRDPWNLDARLFLIDFLPKVGLKDRAHREQDTLNQLANPSSGRTLDRAWPLAEQTRYTSALKIVDEGEQNDPASLSVAAYRWSLVRSAGRADEADYTGKLVLAMAEAKLRVGGQTLSPDAKQALPAKDAALPLLVRLSHAKTLHDTGKFREAADQAILMQKIVRRVPAHQLADKHKINTLPGTTNRGGKGWTTNDLLLASHFRATESLIQIRAYDEASQQLAASQKVKIPSEESPARHNMFMRLLHGLDEKAGSALVAKHFTHAHAEMLRHHRTSQTLTDKRNKTGKYDPNNAKYQPENQYNDRLKNQNPASQLDTAALEAKIKELEKQKAAIQQQFDDARRTRAQASQLRGLVEDLRKVEIELHAMERDLNQRRSREDSFRRAP